MESFDYAPRDLQRQYFLMGAGGSFLVHTLVVIVAVFWQGWQPAKTPFPVFTSVKLTTLEDLGPGKELPELSSRAGPSTPEQPRTRPDEPVPVEPVKRLRFDDAAEAPRIKQWEASEVPVFSTKTPGEPSIEQSLEQLVTKPSLPIPFPREPSDQPGSTSQGSRTEPAPTARDAVRRQPDRTGGDGLAEGGQSQRGGIALARRLYYAEVWNAIRRQWAFPKKLQKSDRLLAILIVVVRRDGKILDLRFEKRSGDPLFDESVVRAVRKAAPLPPFPKAYNPPTQEIGIRFRPKDLSS